MEPAQASLFPFAPENVPSYSHPPQYHGNRESANVSVLSPYYLQEERVEMIQNTNAIVAQDASDSSGLAVLETNVNFSTENS